MKRTLKHASIWILAVGTFFTMQSQESAWKAVSTSATSGMELSNRSELPSKFNLFQLDTENFRSTLSQAPLSGVNVTSNVVVKLPSNDGIAQSFRVYKTNTLHEELAARYPQIVSYKAVGIEDPTASARISIGTDGAHVMISSGLHPTVYIDPHTKDRSYYIQFSVRDLNEQSDFSCHVDDTMMREMGPMPDISEVRNADDGMLRTFRLALACSGEYAQFHLNNQGVASGASDAVKKAAVLSAMNTSMTRVNGIFERDLALTMVIIPNNEDLIFLDASTDPYTNNSPLTMLNENQSTIDAAIGGANYDIGHVFNTGPGGIAQLNSPCTGSKARGSTGLPQPIGERFNVNYTSHEMGHQYGATHAFNNNCQDNITPQTAFEPGSGSTIMSYAGICAPNVQNAGDDYFNGGNVTQMWGNISSGNSTCAAQSATGNAAPVVSAGLDYTIPASTPFVLTGTATDADGDTMTYNWEQRDTQIATMPPRADNTGGPAFRSLPASASPSRYFPAINTVLAGQTGSTWERLASVTRIMRFRFTARDNAPNGGASQSDINFLNINGDTGPFMITSQNTNGTVWTTQSNETVTWDVAGTDGAPINTATVDILFSEDGGQTFDRVLASATANDGSEEIFVPGVNTTSGRIMIRPTDNVYYDINNRNITVEGTLSTLDVSLSDLAVWPNPSNGAFTVSFTATTDSNVSIAMYDLRGRLINTKEYTNVSSNFSERLNYSNLNSGMYFVNITNGGKTTTKKVTIQ